MNSKRVGTLTKFQRQTDFLGGITILKTAIRGLYAFKAFWLVEGLLCSVIFGTYFSRGNQNLSIFACQSRSPSLLRAFRFPQRAQFRSNTKNRSISSIDSIPLFLTSNQTCILLPSLNFLVNEDEFVIKMSNLIWSRLFFLRIWEYSGFYRIIYPNSIFWVVSLGTKGSRQGTKKILVKQIESSKFQPKRKSQKDIES